MKLERNFLISKGVKTNFKNIIISKLKMDNQLQSYLIQGKCIHDSSADESIHDVFHVEVRNTHIMKSLIAEHRKGILETITNRPERRKKDVWD